MKYTVNVGTEFEIASAEVIDPVLIDSVAQAAENKGKSLTRLILVFMIFLFAAACMAAGFYIGFNDGTYNEVAIVWSCAGPIVGLVLGYYFKQSR